MEADYAIELGPDDATLDFPWVGPESGPLFVDLKKAPAAISQVPEAVEYPELAEFLRAVNAPASALASAKCDAWYTTELLPEDEIFGLPGKFGSYVDLVFSAGQHQTSFDHHETFAKRVTDLLKRAPEIPCIVELLVRRCYFEEREGFYLTAYCFGFGTDEPSARRQWVIALKLFETALRQATAAP